MVFGFFKKKKVCPIHDENFIKIDWADDFSLKSAEIQSVLEQVDREQANSENSLKDSLPYMTFLQAESLFSRIKEVFIDDGRLEEFIIDRVSIVHREGNEPPSTEEEVFVSPFLIDFNYQNLLKPMVEAILKEEDFSEYSYDQKRAYFVDSLFPSYMTSLNTNNEVLPIFPSEEEVELGNYEVIIPAFSQPIFDDENQEEVVEQPLQSEVFDQQVQEEWTEQQINYGEVDEESEKSYTETYNFLGDDEEQESLSVPNNVKGDFPPTETRRKQSKNEGLVTESTEPIEFMEFPRFQEHVFEKNFYELYEDEYVPWQLNELKKELNAKIVEKQRINIQAAEMFFSQQLIDFEKIEIERINKVLTEEDSRSSLKSSIIKTMRQLQNDELSQKKDILQADRKRATEEEKQRHEAAMQSIEEGYSQNLNQLEQQLDTLFYEKTNKKYQEKYYEETARLQEILDEEFMQFELKKQQKQQELVNQIHEISSKVGNTVFETKAAQLKQAEVRLVNEHYYAKKLHLVERQEMLKLDETHAMNKYISDLQKQVSEMIEERKKFEHETHAMKQLLFDSKSKALQDQLELNEKLVDATLKKVAAN